MYPIPSKFSPSSMDRKRSTPSGPPINQSVEPPRCTCAARSCFSWSARQYCAQGTASRRAASIWYPHAMHVPCVPVSMRCKASRTCISVCDAKVPSCNDSDVLWDRVASSAESLTSASPAARASSSRRAISDRSSRSLSSNRCLKRSLFTRFPFLGSRAAISSPSRQG